MHTIYDWLTVAVFAGLIVLFLQRSMQEAPTDKLWHYMVASAGCAVTNYFGNEAITSGNMSMHLIAIAVIVATGAFIVYFIRPFPI